MSAMFESFNYGHNILELFDILINIHFATSETEGGC